MHLLPPGVLRQRRRKIVHDIRGERCCARGSEKMLLPKKERDLLRLGVVAGFVEERAVRVGDEEKGQADLQFRKTRVASVFLEKGRAVANLEQHGAFEGRIQLGIGQGHFLFLNEAGLIKGEIDGPRRCYCVDKTVVARLRTLIAALSGAS